jgi:hypothetical protein
MTSTNSKITRVQPVFSWLRENGGTNWPDRFIGLAAGLTVTIKPGELRSMDLDQERQVAASPQRLAWMIRNADSLAPSDGRKWEQLRERASDPQEIQAALERLEQEKSRGLGKLILEGKTHADCFLECERALIWIEGKRFDWISPGTKWDLARDQIARNMEAIWLLANERNKDYCLVICHEHALKHHEKALIDGYRNCTWTAGWPHLSTDQRAEFAKRIGTVTWQRIVDAWPELRALLSLHDLSQETK